MIIIDNCHPTEAYLSMKPLKLSDTNKKLKHDLWFTQKHGNKKIFGKIHILKIC